MAKKIDTSKIERIRQASVEIISECGITGSSVAAIAQRARVSAGYLYRHYPSKVELVNDLLNDALNSITERIDALIGENDRIDRIVSGIIGFILESASLNPYRLKFQIMLLNDFSTELDPAIREQIRQIGETLIRKGHENGSVRKNVNIEDFYIALVGIPMQYLAARYKFGFGANDWDIAAETEKITRISMCAIK